MLDRLCNECIGNLCDYRHCICISTKQIFMKVEKTDLLFGALVELPLGFREYGSKNWRFGRIEISWFWWWELVSYWRQDIRALGRLLPFPALALTIWGCTASAVNTFSFTLLQ